MKRITFWCVAAALMAAAPVAHAATYLGFQIGIGNAPPAPRLILAHEPRVVLVPETRVYMIDDDDCAYDSFRYDNWWYVYDDGHWFRARSYHGPFAVVDVRVVPRAVLTVPASRWRHSQRVDAMRHERRRELAAARERHGRDRDRDHERDEH